MKKGNEKGKAPSPNQIIRVGTVRARAECIGGGRLRIAQ